MKEPKLTIVPPVIPDELLEALAPAINEERDAELREIVDPRDDLAQAPVYKPGQLMPLYERYAEDCIAAYGGDPGTYACAAIAVHCGALHSSVMVQTNPLAPENWRHPNDFSLTLGNSGDNKSGFFKDVTRPQKEWDLVLSREAMAKQRAGGSGGKNQKFKAAFMQNASIEGLLDQLQDNEGEALMVGHEEAMSFYQGAGAHHKENSTNAMADAVNAFYDGGGYRKRLRTKPYNIESARATLVMVTVMERISEWKDFEGMIQTGLMARHTVGVISHVQERDETRVVPGARRAWLDRVQALRAMRHMRFVLASDAVDRWNTFVKNKESSIKRMIDIGAPAGLINWAKKYELRIMSLAVIMQAYDWLDTGSKNHSSETVEFPSGGNVPEIREIKTVWITARNMERAVSFVEGYLMRVQAFFYKIAAGQSEFKKELLNFLASILTNDIHSIKKGDLCGSSGPRCLRGSITDALKEKRKRYVQACMDYGWIEPDHGKGRQFKLRREDTDAAWYIIPDAVHERFADDITFFRAHDAAVQASLEAWFGPKGGPKDDPVSF